jgi:sulfur-oxidizing protein SoxX
MNSCFGDLWVAVVLLRCVRMRFVLGGAFLLTVAACATGIPDSFPPYQISGEEIREPLAGLAGNAARGRDVLLGRDGNCLLCHAVPETGARFMGNLGPPLSGIGARLSAGKLRLRIVDSRRLNTDTIMPPYFSAEGLNQATVVQRGEPVLTAQQVEDLVAYLLTLH